MQTKSGELTPDTLNNESLIKNLSENLLPPRSLEAEQESLNFIQSLQQRRKALITNELTTHYGLTYCVRDDYKGFVVEFCNQIIEEYNCKKPSEIALAEVAACAFVRHLDYAEALRCLLHNLPFNNLVNNSVAIISKEIDRSQRVFATAITLLKQLKSPRLEVKIKTTNAFVAQNQVNATPSPTFKEGEINDGQ